MTRLWLRMRLAWDRRHERPRAWLVAALLLLLAAIAVSASSGAVSLPVSQLPAVVLDDAHRLHAAVWQVRMPRIVCAALVGTSLGIAGTLLQTVVRNPLADPGLLGVTAAAGAGALVAIVLAPERFELVPLAALAGGLLAIGVLWLVTLGQRRGAAPLRLILTGVALQAVFFAAIALVTFFYADRAPAFAAFAVGSLNGVGWNSAALAVGPALLGAVAAVALLRPLDVMLLDDASAGGVGLATVPARFAASAVSALLAAGAVSVAGLVGFVGLVVPNAARLLVGPDHRALLPMVAVGGAALVVIADATARTATAPLELPVGALLALLGAPYFVHLVWRRIP